MKWFRAYLKSDGNVFRGADQSKRPRENEWIYASPEAETVFYVFKDKEGRYEVSQYNPSTVGDRTWKTYYFKGSTAHVDIYQVLEGFLGEKTAEEKVKKTESSAPKKKVKKKTTKKTRGAHVSR